MQRRHIEKRGAARMGGDMLVNDGRSRVDRRQVGLRM